MVKGGKTSCDHNCDTPRGNPRLWKPTHTGIHSTTLSYNTLRGRGIFILTKGISSSKYITLITIYMNLNLNSESAKPPQDLLE